MATKTMTKAKTTTTTATKATAEKAKKKFQDHDTIRCVSCTVGGLLIEGPRSKILYRWTGLGDEASVEYYDLIALLHSRSPFVFKPRFIIQDKDFLAENPQLSKLYDSLYTVDDINTIINMPNDRMVETIKTLPVGIQDAVKGTVAGMIDSGELDSVNKIKALDALYGTNMLLKLAQEA